MAYEGNEDFIFVSYAHKDQATVIPLLESMRDAGFRIWYDSGIEAGTEWPEYIEDHLMRSKVVMVFMTPATVESRNCRNEINFALELKKEVLVVYLEETTLLKGMRLQLNSSQSLFRKHHKSDKTFLRELVEAQILQCCRAKPTAPHAPVPAPPAPQPAPPARKTVNWPLFAMLGAVLAALVIAILVMASKGGEKKDPTPTDTTPTATQTEATEPATEPTDELSDDLFDYTVQIEGTVYRLPCTFEALTAAGWTISSSGDHDGLPVKGGGTEQFTMSANGKRLSVSVYNPSGNATAIKDCPVVGLSWEAGSGIDGQLPQGITVHSGIDEIIAAFGTPADRSEGAGYVSLTYSQSGSVDESIKFVVHQTEGMAKYSSVTIRYYDVGSGPDPTDYPDAVKMSDDPFDHTIWIEGTVYKLPCPYEALTAAGWTISSSGYSDTFMVEGNKTEAFQMSANGKRLYVTAYASGKEAKAIRDCQIVAISWEAGSSVDARLAKGITVSAPLDQILAAYGVPSYRYDGSGYTSISYSPVGAPDREVKFICYTEPGMEKYSSITVKSDGTTDSRADTNTQRPAYLDGYAAPEALGTDYKTPSLRLGGDLYRLPAPVSEFIDNGWKSIEQPNAVPSGNTGKIRMERNGIRIELSVTNFADYQTIPENCAVHKIAVEATAGLAVELPMGISFSSTKADVEAAVTDAFRPYTGTTYHSWTYSEGDFDLDIRVDSETGTVSRISMGFRSWAP